MATIKWTANDGTVDVNASDAMRESGIVTDSDNPINDWKGVHLSDINLSDRTSACLSNMGLTTLGELACLSDSELLMQPNFGRVSLSEVRILLSWFVKIAPETECRNEDNSMDFYAIEGPLLSRLLQRIETLELTTRARNVLRNLEITTVGELVQLTESDLRRTPNAGWHTVNNYKAVLARLGFSLGVTIKNWPNEEDLAVLVASRVPERCKCEQKLIGTFDYLEDELTAVVQETATTRSEHAIVIRRAAWGGDQVWTLDELARNPEVSGCNMPVSRERIRQIESQAIKKIQKSGISTPILSRAIALIEENAPVATVALPSLLRKHGLTQRNFGYEALKAAMKTFQADWNLNYTIVGQDALLLPSDQADEIECCWTILAEAAKKHDYVKLDQVMTTNRDAPSLPLDIVVSGVSILPSLSWIDQERRIYWNHNRVGRGRNKTIKICRKLLTVVPEVPLKRLIVAVKRAKTVVDFPPDEVFVKMLVAADAYEVKDGMVSQGPSFVPGELGKTDWLMVRVAVDTDTVTTFSALREALVRQGLSANYAQVLIASSPFWINTERLRYRFIGNKAQLDDFQLEEHKAPDGLEQYQERYVELEVSHRHLVIGNHRIDEGWISPGQWSLQDEQGNGLGTLDVTETMIRGLNRSLSVAEIGAGMYVIIDFQADDNTATIYW